MEDMEMVRNPTDIERLRKKTIGYLTDKAAAYMEAYKAERYQAAVYIKEQADSVFIFASRTGVLTEEDAKWYTGQGGADPLFHPGYEARARQKVDYDLRQEEVMRRYRNLVRYLRNAFSMQLDVKTAEKVNGILSSTLNKAEKASGE